MQIIRNQKVHIKFTLMRYYLLDRRKTPISSTFLKQHKNNVFVEALSINSLLLHHIHCTALTSSC